MKIWRRNLRRNGSERKRNGRAKKEGSVFVAVYSRDVADLGEVGVELKQCALKHARRRDYRRSALITGQQIVKSSSLLTIVTTLSL